jgi:hypothetical protein
MGQPHISHFWIINLLLILCGNQLIFYENFPLFINVIQ